MEGEEAKGTTVKIIVLKWEGSGRKLEGEEGKGRGGKEEREIRS